MCEDIFWNQTSFIQVKMTIQKGIKPKGNIYQKDIIKNYKFIINGKKFYDQPSD